MKKLLLLLLTVCAAFSVDAAGRSTDIPHCFEFIQTPWRCKVVVSRLGKPDISNVLYYYRDGRRKAAGWMSDNGEYEFYLFKYKDGEIHGNYFVSNRLDNNGQLVQKCLLDRHYEAPFNGMHGFRLLYDQDKAVDSHGNWLVATDDSTSVRRELDYYGESSYNAETDAFLDALYESAPELLRKTGMAQTLSNLKNTPMLILARLFQLVVLATWVYLFMLIFFRRRLYGFFDRLAGDSITPQDGSIFSRLHLHGLIPVSLIVVPEVVLFYLLREQSQERLMAIIDTVAIVMLAVSYLYCRSWVRRRSGEMPAKKAWVSLLFGILGVCAAMSAVVLVFVAIWLAIVLGFLYFGVNTAFGGLLKGGSGNSSVDGTTGAGQCRNCIYRNEGFCTKHSKAVGMNGTCSMYTTE